MSEATPLRLRSAKEAVADELRKLIQAGEFADGERLSIEALATRFGVSRTPVRDALFILEAEGLVVIVPRIGVFIRTITDEEALDVYRIKGELEAITAEWAAKRATQAQRESLLRTMDLLRKAANKKDVTRYVQVLAMVQDELSQMADSAVLADMMKVLSGRALLLRFRNMSDPEALLASVSEHEKVADAVVAGDAKRAFAAMKEHMKGAERRFRKLLNDAAADGADRRPAAG